jgi:hypothetical protein
MVQLDAMTHVFTAAVSISISSVVLLEPNSILIMYE